MANRGIYEDHMEISGLCEVKNSSKVAKNGHFFLLYMRVMLIPRAFLDALASLVSVLAVSNRKYFLVSE